MTNHHKKGHGQGEMTYFQRSWLQSYLWYGWSESHKILYTGRKYHVL